MNVLLGFLAVFCFVTISCWLAIYLTEYCETFGTERVQAARVLLLAPVAPLVVIFLVLRAFVKLLKVAVTGKTN